MLVIYCFTPNAPLSFTHTRAVRISGHQHMSPRIYLYLNARSSLQVLFGFLQRVNGFRTFSEPLKPRKHCAGVRFRHLARETSARGHFEVTWPEKPRLGVTSRSLGSRKLGSKSLRGRENSRKLASKSLRGRENLKKLDSKSLRCRENSRKLGSESL